MRKKIVRFIIIVVLTVGVLLWLYKSLKLLEVNTSAMQVSSSIKEAKALNVFLAEYKISKQGNKFLRIKEAWVQYILKYDVTNREVTKKRGDIISLAIKVDSLGLKLPDSLFLINWDLHADCLGNAARINGIYKMDIWSNPLPKKINVAILYRDSFPGSYTKIDSFYLIKQ